MSIEEVSINSNKTKESGEFQKISDDLEFKKDPSETKNESLDRVIELTNLMSKDTDKALNTINTINRKTEFLAVNALIEASRAGDAGKGFQVVAESIDVLAVKTKEAVEKMRKETLAKMSDLGKVIQKQSDSIRGGRLSDLALTNIDLIDRNLFERTADVRWWATDTILVEVLSHPSEEKSTKANERLGTILQSYTVYYDLILCDNEGKVISSGHPEKFDLRGKNFSDKQWFQKAIKTENGEEFAYQSVHKSSVSGELTMTFSCKVHQNGDINKPVLGILAAVFDWRGLANKIVNETPLTEEEKLHSRVCVVDENGLVLADTNQRELEERVHFPEMENLFQRKRDFIKTRVWGKNQLICHGLSPGYETFSSGWHSLIFFDFE